MSFRRITEWITTFCKFEKRYAIVSTTSFNEKNEALRLLYKGANVNVKDLDDRAR